MDFKEFETMIRQDVEELSSVSGESNAHAFTNKVVTMMQDTESLPDEEFMPVFYENTSRIRGRKMRIDGYLFDHADNSCYLFICDIDSGTMTKTLADANFKKLTTLADDVLHTDLYLDVEPSRPEADMMEELRREAENVTKYKLILLTNSLKSSRLQNIPNKEIDDLPAECQVWDIERIYNIYNSTQNAEPIEIDFTKYEANGIPCLKADENSTYQSYLGVLSGQLLADIYNEYGSRLLEGNVRSFLSSKRAVNKKIRATILNEPVMFFAYNNGIAATARDLKFACSRDGLRLVKAVDFQIINGGQTTASLANAMFKDKGRADLSQISVQMKLTQIDNIEADAASELIRNISRSSNSQNKVSEADFFATSPFHVEMEKFSRRLRAPASEGCQYETYWFYERARGQYLQEQMKMTTAEKNIFKRTHPKNQVITKTDLAKFIYSWEGHPDIVSKGAQANFLRFADDITKKWETDKDQFSELYFKRCIALAIFFKYLENLVSQQEWYNSYRANIVTYTLAIFHKAIKSVVASYDFDLMKIWNKQAVPIALESYLIDLAKAVNDFITGERPTSNVTQWCKQEACWTRIQKSVCIPLPDQGSGFTEFLQQKTELTKEKKDAKKTQQFDSEIKCLGRIIQIPEAVWQQILLDARQNKLIRSDKEQQALLSATHWEKRPPQGFQAQMLVDFLEYMKENGFHYTEN